MSETGDGRGTRLFTEEVAMKRYLSGHGVAASTGGLGHSDLDWTGPL